MDAIDAQANEIRKQIVTLPPDDPRVEAGNQKILALYRGTSAEPPDAGTTALTGARAPWTQREPTEGIQRDRDYQQWKYAGNDARQLEANMWLDTVYDDATSMEHRIL